MAEQKKLRISAGQICPAVFASLSSRNSAHLPSYATEMTEANISLNFAEVSYLPPVGDIFGVTVDTYSFAILNHPPILNAFIELHTLNEITEVSSRSYPFLLVLWRQNPGKTG